jgi:hypothetical protein
VTNDSQHHAEIQNGFPFPSWSNKRNPELFEYQRRVESLFAQEKFPDVTGLVGGKIILGCWMKVNYHGNGNNLHNLCFSVEIFLETGNQNMFIAIDLSTKGNLFAL